MSEDAHVYPLNDLFEHDTETRDGCLCGATIKFVDGGCVVTHNSMDGREKDE